MPPSLLCFYSFFFNIFFSCVIFNAIQVIFQHQSCCCFCVHFVTFLRAKPGAATLNLPGQSTMIIHFFFYPVIVTDARSFKLTHTLEHIGSFLSSSYHLYIRASNPVLGLAISLQVTECLLVNLHCTIFHSCAKSK